MTVGITHGTADSGVLGAVLVGGSSRRMGRDKALIDVDGQPLVERAAMMLGLGGCVEVVAIGPASLAASVTAVVDLHPGEGPLGGILTALATAGNRGCLAGLVVACDMPGLDSATVARLVEQFAGAGSQPEVVPRVVIARSNRLEPLCAIWSTGCAGVLQRAFDDGVRAVRDALDGIRVEPVDVELSVVRNVNTPDDLRNG